MLIKCTNLCLLVVKKPPKKTVSVKLTCKKSTRGQEGLFARVQTSVAGSRKCLIPLHPPSTDTWWTVTSPGVVSLSRMRKEPSVFPGASRSLMASFLETFLKNHLQHRHTTEGFFFYFFLFFLTTSPSLSDGANRWDHDLCGLTYGSVSTVVIAMKL